MPNDVTSTVTVTGPVDAVDEFKRTHINPKKNEVFFDFRTVTPMPKALEGSVSPPRNKALARKLIKETGYPDWYEWAMVHWGTRWTSYDGKEVSDKPGKYVFRFDTAWSFPTPVFESLAVRYPSLVFDIATYDEGGSFGGVGQFNGQRNFKIDHRLATPEVYQLAYGKVYEEYDGL